MLGAPDIEVLARVPIYRLLVVYDEPRHRPPVLDEMLPDLEKLIASMVPGYVDFSCQALHQEDLIAEGRYKLSMMLDKGWLDRCPTRAKFFGAFKLAFKRHLCSLVGKHRFTQKRTGVKAPPRGAAFTGHEHGKCVEISLDDPDAHVQVSDTGATNDETEWHQTREEYRAILSPHEQLVYDQLTQPDLRSYLYALEDAYRGHRPGEPLIVDIRTDHLARGLGMEVDLFQSVVLRVRDKIKDYRAMSNQEQDTRNKWNAAVATLAGLFELQIPPGIEDIIIKRMLTLAAMHQYKKVEKNQQVKELLMLVGARVPVPRGDTFSCFGLLHSQNDRRCRMCSLRQNCQVETDNVGLGTVLIADEILGARKLRVPVLLPQIVEDGAPPATASVRDMEIVEYLCDHFRYVEDSGELVFYFRETGHDKDIFRVNNPAVPLKLRFCTPTEDLCRALTKQGHGWYAPDSMDSDEIIELIDQHAQLEVEPTT